MSISIIFPINFEELTSTTPSTRPSVGPAPGQSPVRIRKRSFGASCYADWEATDAIKQNLKMLLLTREGEYVMDQNYGVGLPEYLFELDTGIDTDALKSKIISQASVYLPYMDIINIEINLESDRNVMNLRIEFSYNDEEILSVFELQVL